MVVFFYIIFMQKGVNRMELDDDLFPCDHEAEESDK